MILQIKTLAGTLQEEQKRYIRKKFLWLEERLPNSAVLTVGVREHITKRSNQAYEILIHLDSPKTKRPYYAKTFGNSFTESVDSARDKIERIVLRLKEKKGFKFKIKLPSFKFSNRKNEKPL